MDEAPCALAPLGSVVNRLTSTAAVRRRHMTLRPMAEPGCYTSSNGTAARNRRQPQRAELGAASLAQSAKNMSPSAAAADRPPMTIPRDDRVARCSCCAIIRTRAATVPGDTVCP